MSLPFSLFPNVTFYSNTLIGKWLRKWKVKLKWLRNKREPHLMDLHQGILSCRAQASMPLGQWLVCEQHADVAFGPGWRYVRAALKPLCHEHIGSPYTPEPFKVAPWLPAARICVREHFYVRTTQSLTASSRLEEPGNECPKNWPQLMIPPRLGHQHLSSLTLGLDNSSLPWVTSLPPYWYFLHLPNELLVLKSLFSKNLG